MLLPLLVLCLLIPINADGPCVSSGRKYNETVYNAFFAKKLRQTISLTCDPYQNASCAPFPFPTSGQIGANAVCGVKYDDDQARTTYQLITYSNTSEAAASGAHVTHNKACGACSTLQDLAVYMKETDLTGPVRKCGLKGFFSKKWSMTCLKTLGFTPACAEIWYDNTINTREQCFGICIWDLPIPYNDPEHNCDINACLQCDETKSDLLTVLLGPLFKLFSGRTRRDSGLFSAIYRPPSTIYNIVHDYY